MISKEYLQLLEDMKKMHEQKNAGYSGKCEDAWANFRNAEKFGVSASRGCLIRMSDKYARLVNLVQDPSLEQVNEKVEDTLMDLASYALIALCLLKEENDKVA